MRSIVIYFSQTGNTEKVATSIRTGIVQATGQCDLSEIRQTSPLRLREYDLIGIGSPVIGQCPENVLEFARRMQFVGGKHAFTFCTHGASHKRFHPSLYPVLANRGLTVIGSADWYGNCYLLHMPQPYPTAGHPDAIDLGQAETFGREMGMRSMRVSAGQTELIPAAPPEMAPKAPTPEVGKDEKSVLGSFSAMLEFDKNKCLYPNCTLCMDNCPTYGIDLSFHPPLLAQPCITCEFCARICPTGALDMKPWLEAMEQTTVAAMPKMLDSLERAEVEGSFRRLLPLSEIDIARVGHRQYTTHPQWILGKGAQRNASGNE